MFCKYCGKEIENDTVKCPECGGQIGNLDNGSSNYSIPGEQPVQPAGVSEQNVNGSYQSDAPQQEEYTYTYSQPEGSGQQEYTNAQSSYETPTYGQGNNSQRPYESAPYSYDNSSYQPDPPIKNRTGFAIASLVLGIASIVLCCIYYVTIPVGIIGLVLGILALKSTSRGMAIAGIVLSSIGLVASIGFLIFAILAYTDPYFMDGVYYDYFY